MADGYPTGICKDCRAEVVFFRLDNGRCSPPMRPERTREGYWQIHECSFAERRVGKTGRTRMHRNLDGCAEHQIVRLEHRWQFVALNRETRQVVSTNALDEVCKRKLKTLRDELGGMTPSESCGDAFYDGAVDAPTSGADE